MQTLSQIRELLESAGIRPRKRFGQNFLIDGNLMGVLLDLAAPAGDETVLEVGAGTGSLTEELLERAGAVVAVEIDDRLAGLLQDRLGGREGFVLVRGDALASKHVLSPAVLEALGGSGRVHLVSNLPYNAAVPLILNCLLASWRSLRGGGVCFERLTFTVQRELSQRLTAAVGEEHYGPASIIAALLADAQPGRAVPAQAFWPAPRVTSRMLRLDFRPERAGLLDSAEMLSTVLAATFGQRRKKISAAAGRRDLPADGGVFLAALSAAEIDPGLRPEQVAPEGFLALANALATGKSRLDVVQ
jgi:16S rRNA (adenine1518-N6/adenine1519-N6)-dimethyltransferase